MNGSPDTIDPRRRAPDARPEARTDEQELVAGRSAATPFAAIFSVAVLVGIAVTLALALVVVVLLAR